MGLGLLELGKKGCVFLDIVRTRVQASHERVTEWIIADGDMDMNRGSSSTDVFKRYNGHGKIEIDVIKIKRMLHNANKRTGIKFGPCDHANASFATI